MSSALGNCSCKYSGISSNGLFSLTPIRAIYGCQISTSPMSNKKIARYYAIFFNVVDLIV